jgi:hypothetical protein
MHQVVLKWQLLLRQEQAWDVGIAGLPPNVVAGFKDILTIGINNDEGAANEILGAPGV